MIIGSIAIRMAADASGFIGQVERAAKALDRIAESGERARAATSGLDFPAGDGTSGGAPAAVAGAADAGRETGAILASSLAPLAKIGATVTAQLDRVGGTVVTLARRIDASMKFDALDAGLAKVASKLESEFARGSVGALRAILKVKDALSHMGDVAGKGLDRVVRLDFSRAQSGATGLTRTFQALPAPINAASGAVKHLGLQIGLALGVVGLAYKATQAVAGFFTAGIKGAGDLAETMSKTGEVFGPYTADVVKNADAMARSFGLPKGAILDAASSIGLIAKGAGQGTAESARMANSLARLAADASSFYNVPLDTALEKIRSGLVGEAEPLRAFGVLLSEDAVKAEAAAMGLSEVKGKLDEASKVAARYSLITKGLATASGDLDRTQGSVSNQFRKLSGSISNAATMVGGFLMPAIEAGVGALNRLVSAVTGFFERSKSTIRSFAGYIAAGIRNYAEMISELPQTLGVFAGDFARVFGDLPSRVFSRFRSLLAAAVAQAGVVLRNLPTYAAIAREKIREQIETIPEYFRFVRETAAEAGAFLADRFRYAGRVIGAEVAYWVDHVRFFKDSTLALMGALPGIVGGSFLEATGAVLDIVPNLTRAVAGFLTQLATDFAGAARFIASPLIEGVTIGVGAIRGLAGVVMENFRVVLDFFAGGVMTLASPFVEAARIGLGAFKGLFDGITGIFGELAGLFGDVAKLFGQTVSMSINKGVNDAMKNVRAIESRASVAGPKAFELPELPKIAGHQGEIEALRKKLDSDESATRLQRQRDALAKIPRATESVKPTLPDFDAADKDKDKDKKKGRADTDVAALEFGSKEAASAVAKFRNEGPDQQPAKATAKNTEDLVKVQRESLAYLKRATEAKDPVKLAIAKL